MDFEKNQLRVNLVRLEDSQIKNNEVSQENIAKRNNGFKSKKIKKQKRKEQSEKYTPKNYKRTKKIIKNEKPYTDAFKLKILQKLAKGESVKKLAILHDVSESSIFYWRRCKQNIESTYKIYVKNVSGKRTKNKKSLKANIKSFRLQKKDLLKEREKVEIINKFDVLINKRKESAILKSTSLNIKSGTACNIKSNDSRVFSTSFENRDKENLLSKHTQNSHLILKKTPIIRLKRLSKNSLYHEEKQKDKVHCKSCKCSSSSDTELSKKNKTHPDFPDMQEDHAQNPNGSSITETSKDNIDATDLSNYLPQTKSFSNVNENTDQLDEENNSIPSLNTTNLPDKREKSDNRPAEYFPDNRETIEDRSTDEINFIPLAQTKDSLDIREEEEEKKLRSYTDANYSVPIDYLCRDCGLEWELMCSNIPVDTIINDLGEYRRNLRAGNITKNHRKMYLTMLWLKAKNDSDNTNTETPETLTCVVPYEETNWAWEIKHLDTESRCQLLPHVSKKSTCLSHEVKEDLDWNDEDNWQTVCITECVALRQIGDTAEVIKEEPDLTIHDQFDDDVNMSDVNEKNYEETQIRSSESLNQILEIKEEDQHNEDFQSLDTLIECKEESLHDDSKFQVFNESNNLNDHYEETLLCTESEIFNALNSPQKKKLVTISNKEKKSNLSSSVKNMNGDMISFTQTEDIASLRIMECLSENDICCEEEELIDENINLDNCNNENGDNNVDDDGGDVNYSNKSYDNHHNKEFSMNGNKNNSEKQSEQLVVNVSYENIKGTAINEESMYEEVVLNKNDIILEQIADARTNETSNIVQPREILRDHLTQFVEPNTCTEAFLAKNVESDTHAEYILAQDVAPDTCAEVVFTPQQLSVLSTQLLQHRQLLLTSTLLCYNNSSLHYIQEGCHQYLEEVKNLTERNEIIKLMDKQGSCMEETLKTSKALKCLQENNEESQNNRNKLSSVKDNCTKKKMKKVNLHTTIVALILESSAFPYPCLLPTCMFTQQFGKSLFLPSEDSLLAMGMDKYSYRDIEQKDRSRICYSRYKAEAIEEIRKKFLPSKQPDQIHTRIKNISTRFKDNNNQNPVSHYLHTGNLVVPAAESKKVSPLVPCPVSQFPWDMLPELWKEEYLQLHLKKSPSTWPPISEDCSRQKIIIPCSTQNNAISYVFILPQTAKVPLLVSSSSLLNCQGTSKVKSTENENTEILSNDSSKIIAKKVYEDKRSVNIQEQNTDDNGLQSRENALEMNLNSNELNIVESFELNTIYKSKVDDITYSVAINNTFKNAVIEAERRMMKEPIKQLVQMGSILNRDKSYETISKSISSSGTATSSTSHRGGIDKMLSSIPSHLDLNTPFNITHSQDGFTTLKDISKDLRVMDKVSLDITADNIDVKDEAISGNIDVNELDFAMNYKFSDTENIINPCEETKPNLLSLENQFSFPQTQITGKNVTSVSDAFVRIPVSALNHVNSSNLQRRSVPIAPKTNIVENNTVNVATMAVNDTSVDSVMSFSTKEKSVSKHLCNDTDVLNKKSCNRKKIITSHKPGYHNKEERSLPSNERKLRKRKNPNKVVSKTKKVCDDAYLYTSENVIEKLEEMKIQRIKLSESENALITSEMSMVPINTISQQTISEISPVPNQTEYQRSTQNKKGNSIESADFITSVHHSTVETLIPKTESESFDNATISPEACKSTNLMTIKLPLLSIVNSITIRETEEKSQESSTEIGENSLNSNILMGESNGNNMLENDATNQSELETNGEVLSLKEEASESPMTTNLPNINLIPIIKFSVPLSSATEVRTSNVSLQFQNKNRSIKENHLAITDKASDKQVTVQGTNNGNIDFISNNYTDNEKNNNDNKINKKDDKGNNINMNKYNSINKDIKNENIDIEKENIMNEKNTPTLSKSKHHNQLQLVKEKASGTTLCSDSQNSDLISKTKSAITLSPVILPISSVVTLPNSAATEPVIASIVSQAAGSSVPIPPNTSTPYVSKEGQRTPSMPSIDNISPVTRYPAMSLPCGIAKTSIDSHYLPKSIYSAICDVSKIGKTQDKNSLIGTCKRKNKFYKFNELNRKTIVSKAIKDSDEYTNTGIKSDRMDKQPNDDSISIPSGSRNNLLVCYSEKDTSKDVLNEIAGSHSFVNNDMVNKNISTNKETCSSSSNPCVSPNALCSVSPNNLAILFVSKKKQIKHRTRKVSGRSAIEDSVSKGIPNEILKNSEGDTRPGSFVNNDIENVSISGSLCQVSSSPGVSPKVLSSTSLNPPDSFKGFCTSSPDEPSVLTRSSCSFSPNTTVSTLNTSNSQTLTEKSFSTTQPNYDNVSFFSRVDKLQKLEDRMIGKETERVFKFRRYSKGRGRREINFSKSDIIDSRPRRKIKLSSSNLSDSSANFSAISVHFGSGQAEEQQQNKTTVGLEQEQNRKITGLEQEHNCKIIGLEQEQNRKIIGLEQEQSSKIIGLEQEQNRKFIGLEQEQNRQITESSSRKISFVDEYVPKSSIIENKINNTKCSAESSTYTSKRTKWHCDSSKLTSSVEKEKHSSDILNQHNISALSKKLSIENQRVTPRKYRLIKPKPSPTLEISESILNPILSCSKNIPSQNSDVNPSNHLGNYIYKNQDKTVPESDRKCNLNLKSSNVDRFIEDKERNKKQKTLLERNTTIFSGKLPQRKRHNTLSKRIEWIKADISNEEMANSIEVDVSGQLEFRNKWIGKNSSKEIEKRTKIDDVNNQSNSSSGAISNTTDFLNSTTNILSANASIITDPESCIISWLQDNYEQDSSSYLIQDQVYRHFVKAMHSMGNISGFNGNGLSLMDPILITSCVLKVFDKVKLEDKAADRWGVYNGLAKLKYKTIRGNKRKS